MRTEESHNVMLHRASLAMRHRAHGQGLTEFGPALALLMMLLMLIIDFASLPLRYIIAEELIEHSVRRLAQSETFSEAKSEFEGVGELRDALVKTGGIKPVNLELRLIANSLTKGDASIVVTESRTISSEWLPNGSLCPCNYSLQLVAKLEISPAFLVNLPSKIVGLSAPMPCQLSSTARWENLTRNPESKDYFLNE